MEFKNWFEATTNYTEKLIDPALLTFPEFWELINPSHKHHSDSAYDWSIKKLEKTKADYPTLLYRKPIGGIDFEFRVNKKDNYQDNHFVKTTPDGEFLRINGQVQYYTRQELIELGKHNRYEYDFGVFHNNQCVGVTQDEWGCLLVSVGREYRGFGLGPILTRLAWEAEPGKDSGGCTNRGAATVRKVHGEFVKDYLQKGFYSLLVKDGKLTTQRVKQIIDSANSKPTKAPKDVGTDDSKNWLLFHEDNLFIVYDKKLKDLYQDEDNYWTESTIKAMGDVGSMLHENENYRLRHLGGETEKLKKLMLICCLQWVAEDNNKPLYVYEEDLPLVDETMTMKKEGKNAWVKLKKKSDFDPKPMAKLEKQWRKSFDKYDEFKVSLMEIATAKYH